MKDDDNYQIILGSVIDGEITFREAAELTVTKPNKLVNQHSDNDKLNIIEKDVRKQQLAIIAITGLSAIAIGKILTNKDKIYIKTAIQQYEKIHNDLNPKYSDLTYEKNNDSDKDYKAVLKDNNNNIIAEIYDKGRIVVKSDYKKHVFYYGTCAALKDGMNNIYTKMIAKVLKQTINKG